MKEREITVTHTWWMKETTDEEREQFPHAKRYRLYDPDDQAYDWADTINEARTSIDMFYESEAGIYDNEIWIQGED